LSCSKVGLEILDVSSKLDQAKYNSKGKKTDHDPVKE